MPIRVTGMYSGLDTESIITQLASAQSVKKNKLVKEQIRLSWKQDAWKALNTKIYNFYTNTLDNMRWQGSYRKKMTSVSNANAVSVVTSSDAPNSVQTMQINKLAKQGYLTSGQLAKVDGGQVSESSTLEDLGFAGDADGKGSFRVKVGNKTMDIEVNKDMKISEVVKKLQSAGINASFDAKNQRFYLSSKDSGLNGDFTITSNNAGGKDALKSLGLITAYNKDSNEYKEYEKWANYGSDPTASPRKEAEADEVAKLIANKKASTDALLKANEDLKKRLESIQKENDENDKYDIDYDPADKEKINEQAKKLYDELYGEEKPKQKLDDDGNPVFDNGNPVYEQKLDDKGQPMVDDNGDPVYVMERNGGLNKALGDAKEALKKAKEELEQVKKDNPADSQAVKDAEQKVVDASSAASQAQVDFNKKSGHYSYVQAVASTQNAIEANRETIRENEKYYTVGADNKLQATAVATGEVTQYFDDKIAAANDYLQDAAKFPSLSDEEKKKYATKIDGQDAEITLNGVSYTNSKNTFEINGLTITAQQETTEPITLTTTEDTDGIYDMIKNFFTEYNKLVNEMSTLYNADSSKGYDPLLSEEKAELADSEIEEWEKKIKDSILRRDSTLRDVNDAIKTVMMKGATVNGKTMYLSDFGINTLGYFKAADNEKGAYHINGDKDDSAVATENDDLRAMIAADPDTVTKFFSSLSENLHNELADKMKSVKDTSSAFTVYNDKTLKAEYDDYKDRIKKEETKLNDLMDKWYAKFSAMETALAKLQSKNNAVSGMFGG